MENKESRADYGVAFVVFIVAVIIHNTFAPSEFRRELNEYSMKCYTILVLIRLLCAYIKDRIDAKRRKEAIEAEEERLRQIREKMERLKKDEKNKRED